MAGGPRNPGRSWSRFRPGTTFPGFCMRGISDRHGSAGAGILRSPGSSETFRCCLSCELKVAPQPLVSASAGRKGTPQPLVSPSIGVEGDTRSTVVARSSHKETPPVLWSRFAAAGRAMTEPLWSLRFPWKATPRFVVSPSSEMEGRTRICVVALQTEQCAARKLFAAIRPGGDRNGSAGPGADSADGDARNGPGRCSPAGARTSGAW
jgi:hypothetical protein